MNAISENIKSILREIPQKTKLVVVTKNQDISKIEQVYQSGVKDFGENKVQEAKSKYDYFQNQGITDIRWHLIGHLQKNKIKSSLDIFSLIHSIDSLELLQKIDNANLSKEILLQIKLAEDPNKHGFTPEDINEELISVIKNLKNIKVMGLMTILPLYYATPLELFRKLTALKDQLNKKYDLKLSELSMGMSNDYQEAIKSGSTIIRIGSKIFN